MESWPPLSPLPSPTLGAGAGTAPFAVVPSTLTRGLLPTWCPGEQQTFVTLILNHPPLLEMGRLFHRGRVFCLRTHSFGMLRREQRENVAASAPSSAPQHTSSLADTHLSNPQERPQHGRFFSCSYFSCPEERTHVRASVAEQ